MTTISNSTTIGITLTPASYSNPVVVNSGVTVANSGYAVSGIGESWTIQNDGKISSTSAFSVLLLAGGSVTNAASGSIAGSAGIAIFGTTGTVVNSGGIAGTTFAGVYLGSGGLVTNAASASITGGQTGVEITRGAGTVVNSGGIAGTTFTGVYLGSGGSVTNAASASITGGQTGVAITKGAGAVVNSGSIAGSLYVGVALASGGSVTNAASAAIKGGNAGVYVISSAGTVVNSGSIVGTSFAGVFLKAGGSVTNATAASITGAGYGIRIVSGTGTVVNSGSVVGTGTASTGVFVSGGGSVTNAAAASISGGAAGIGILGAAGTVVNSGSIAGKYGIVLGLGGSITNATSASIAGRNVGVLVNGAAGTVVNFGRIVGSSGSYQYGVLLNVGGSVTNAASASITGHTDGVLIRTSAGTVVNSGSIAVAPGQQHYGVLLSSGGSVTNAASASITAAWTGVHIGGVETTAGGAGTVVNSGTIVAGTGAYGAGIYLHDGGFVTNAASASITGDFGVVMIAGGTVVNAGTITSASSYAVLFQGTQSGRLVVDPGAVFGGKAAGSTSGSDVLELASGGSTGTLGGLGTSFTNFGSVTVDSGASWELTGTNTIAVGGAMVNSGTLTLSGATLTVSGSLVNDGAIVLDPSTLTVANMSGSGSVAISSGSILNVGSGLASNVTVSGGGMLTVSSGATASGTVVSSGGVVDVLDGGMLAGVVANDGTVNYDITDSASFGGTLTGGGTLVVSGGGDLNVVSAYTGAAQIDDTSTLEFTGAYAGAATFSGSSTGSGGTLKFDAGSTGPITVVNPNDTVIAQPGSGNWIDAIVSYTLPANIDTLFLFAGAHGTGNSDAAGDALYALDATNTQTLTGNSANDTFVVYNSSDVVAPKAGSHDTVYAAASYTLPTGVDTLFLEGTAAQGTGNSDAAGNALYAANPGQVATLTGNSANDVFVVYNSSDVVVPKAGSHDLVYSAVNYTLPSGVDVLYLEAGIQGVGNGDAAGDALYAADAGIAQTLTGNSANDVFVVYNSSDVVAPKAGSHDVVYSAVNYTLPTGVDVLFLEAGTQAVGNSDAAGDTLYAADAAIAQTLSGNSHNDTFVVYNSSDTVVGQSGSTDRVYAAANFTLPTNVDTLYLEGNASLGTGNSDATNMLFGNFGVASTLVAGSGTDALYVTGTAGTILTGGTGHDTFAFPDVMGHDEVTNFGLAKDTLQFNMTLFSNFTAAMNHASQSGANTVFTIDANDTVTLDNVTKTSLTAGNFHFV